MDGLVVWFFFAIAQMHGQVGTVADTQQQCVEAREELLKHADVLFITDCMEVKLHKVAKESKTL